MGERGFYFSHIGYLHGNLTHVPLLLKHGDRLVGRRRDFCQHLDLVPTILRVLGLESDPRFRGRDLRETGGSQKEIFAATSSLIDGDGGKLSVVVDGFKLIFNMKTRQYQLYDLENDPREEHDLAPDEEYLRTRVRLAKTLTRIRAEDRLQLAPVEKSAPPSAEELRRLNALGYVR
jgi:arylsulfatase A-like enzyme